MAWVQCPVWFTSCTAESSGQVWPGISGAVGWQSKTGGHQPKDRRAPPQEPSSPSGGITGADPRAKLALWGPHGRRPKSPARPRGHLGHRRKNRARHSDVLNSWRTAGPQLDGRSQVEAASALAAGREELAFNSPLLAHSGQTPGVQLALVWRAVGVGLRLLAASEITGPRQLGAQPAFQQVLSPGFRRFAW